MSTTRTRGILTAAAAIILAASAIGGTAAAQAAGNNDQHDGNTAESGSHKDTNTALADAFNGVDRSTNWQQTSKLKLNFPTYHTEGIAYSQDHIFLSAVQILEPTTKFPSPQDGSDRTPGKGIGHLFVMDKAGNLQKDIILGEGDMYHPGGIDFDGTNVWVPVAQYRPNSSAISQLDERTKAMTTVAEDPCRGGLRMLKTFAACSIVPFTVRSQSARNARIPF